MSVSSMVYLDHNATTPARPAVVEAMTAVLGRTGNPSSVHGPGRAARRTVEDAREAVAGLVHAASADVVFTSGGTEANNLALRGLGRGRVLGSAVEHDSVLKAVSGLTSIPVDADGIVDLDALEAMLAAESGPALVAVMLANNETGVIQPVARVADIARRHGALVHCDAVQAVGKVAVDFAALGVATMAVSAHKMGGPQGIGALIVAPGMPLDPFMLGGGQERRRRAGTENVAGMAGFGVAAELAGDLAFQAARRDRLEGEVVRMTPSVRVFGAGAPRLPNTSCFALPGMGGDVQVMALDLDGIAVAAGAACASGKATASHVLVAQGASVDDARCAIRVSLGWNSDDADVDRFLEGWRRLLERTGYQQF